MPGGPVPSECGALPALPSRNPPAGPAGQPRRPPESRHSDAPPIPAAAFQSREGMRLPGLKLRLPAPPRPGPCLSDSFPLPRCSGREPDPVRKERKHSGSAAGTDRNSPEFFRQPAACLPVSRMRHPEEAGFLAECIRPRSRSCRPLPRRRIPSVPGTSGILRTGVLRHRIFPHADSIRLLRRFPAILTAFFFPPPAAGFLPIFFLQKSTQDPDGPPFPGIPGMRPENARPCRGGPSSGRLPLPVLHRPLQKERAGRGLPLPAPIRHFCPEARTVLLPVPELHPAG